MFFLPAGIFVRQTQSSVSISQPTRCCQCERIELSPNPFDRIVTVISWTLYFEVKLAKFYRGGWRKLLIWFYDNLYNLYENYVIVLYKENTVLFDLNLH